MTKRLRECRHCHHGSRCLMGFYRKQFQKLLTKQGIKFKLNTKVMSADKVDGGLLVKTQSAKGDKEETVGCSNIWL